MSTYFKYINSSLVQKILEQGQRLRNAMVESILNNETNQDSLHFNTPRNSELELLKDMESERSIEDKLKAFLKGDYMSKEDEAEALDTLRSMSLSELCRTTDRTYRSQDTSCKTCIDYSKRDLNLDMDKPESFLRKHASNLKTENAKYLRHVDCIKVSIYSLTLNEAGNRKLDAQNLTENFFLEYSLPEELVLKSRRSKVDSGLNSGIIKICSKRFCDSVPFRHIKVHDITNLESCDLDMAFIKFKISFRNKSKPPEILGYAKLSFTSLQSSQNLTCNYVLNVSLSESSPISLGSLKVNVQLGCGKIYFGRELIEAINQNNRQENVYVPVNDTKPKEFVRDKKLTIKPKTCNISIQTAIENAPSKPTKEMKPKKIDFDNVLIGFLYVSQAQYLTDSITSYFTCKPFCSDSVSRSQLMTKTNNPIFNFNEVIPLIVNEELLLKFRENYTVLEFWNKAEKETLLGLSKISLQQFYTAYRNPVILKYLKEKPLPVIGTDWWEPIFEPSTDEEIGQVQLVIALGTQAQIDNLKAERGFNSKKVNLNIPQPEKPKLNIVNKKTVKDVLKKESVDKAVQSNLEMDKKDDYKDALNGLLNQIINSRPRNISVENGTNTEVVESNKNETEVRSTSDLLNSLEKALTTKPSNEYFQCQVIIHGALHLPSRKKCKSKKSRCKGGKFEESILPSTYVTFEGMPQQLKITRIVPRSTNPQWDFSTEVKLPSELLTNCQKKLIFKVWRKSTNTVMQPNMQADIVLGFAALDLTVLLSGLPNVQGWFNIIDFTGKCNGQINIHINPLEELNRFKAIKKEETETAPAFDPDEDIMDGPSEFLSRALKRKFIELDEITQRLRLRLSTVTNEESDGSNDDIADEFEKDINTLCVEDDFDLVNFEEEAKKFNINHTKEEKKDSISALKLSDSNNTGSDVSLSLQSSSSSLQSNKAVLSLDKHLIEGKQKIDTLLEKLTLISNDMPNRYVSGCSVSGEKNVDTEAILKDLDHFSRPNIHASCSFDPNLLEQMYDCREDSSETSESSGRPAPDGQGVLEEEKQ